MNMTSPIEEHLQTKARSICEQDIRMDEYGTDPEIFHLTGDTRDATVIPDPVKQHRQNDIYTSFPGLLAPSKNGSDVQIFLKEAMGELSRAAGNSSVAMHQAGNNDNNQIIIEAEWSHYQSWKYNSFILHTLYYACLRSTAV